MLRQCLEMKARGFCMHVFLVRRTWRHKLQSSGPTVYSLYTVHTTDKTESKIFHSNSLQSAQCCLYTPVFYCFQEVLKVVVFIYFTKQQTVQFNLGNQLDFELSRPINTEKYKRSNIKYIFLKQKL